MDSEPLTITAAAPLIRSGQLTPSDLLEQCLARIDRYEEKVRAWVYLDRERARTEASQLTDEIQKGHYRSPLHGIPVGIKDIIDVFDMPTGCGSKMWANSYARRDATCVQRLRESGAVILGKTVTTPYAYLDPPPTRNPWNLERTPGGSSSGSAAAVACGMCLAALGTQTGGSITRPASYCGVYSLKPTYGRVSIDGVLPLAPSLDHVGVMANCVWDLAAVFHVIAGPHSDSEPGYLRCQPVPDSLSNLGSVRDDLRREPIRPELCFLSGLFDEHAEPAIRNLVRSLADRLHAEGAWASQVVPPAGFADVHRSHRTVMAVEAAVFHKDRLERHPDDYPPQIRKLIEDGLRTSAVEYRQSRVARDQLEQEVDNVINGARFLACPATTCLPPDPATTGNPAFNSPWSFTGQPTVSVPFAWSEDGLPVALQLVGSETEEANLLSAAAWCERVIGLTTRLPTPVNP